MKFEKSSPKWTVFGQSGRSEQGTPRGFNWPKSAKVEGHVWKWTVLRPQTERSDEMKVDRLKK